MKRLILLLCVRLLSFTVVCGQEGNSVDTLSNQYLFHTAYMSRYGINTDVDLEKAAKIYMRLARRGETNGMVELGDMYAKGEGVEQNYRYAHRLFMRAAEKGNPLGMCQLARLYHLGLGVRQNFFKAFELYRQAAEKGNPHGCYGAGYMLYKGFGVRQSYTEAEKYLKKGSEKKHAGCDFLLGTLYTNDGAGIPDYTKAEHYYNRALKGGHRWVSDLVSQNKLDSLKNRNRNRKRHVAGERWREKLQNRGDIDMKEVTPSLLNGKWEGILYTYDWSNTKTVDEENITVEFEEISDSFILRWFKNDSLQTVFEPNERNDFAWRNLRIASESRKYPWVITKTIFGMGENGHLYIRLNRVNNRTREPLRPAFAVLHKVESESIEPHIVKIDKLSPLPVTGSDIAVTLSTSLECKVKMEIFTTQGQKVYDGGTKNLPKGTSTLKVGVPNKKGIYLLHISGSGFAESKIFTHL